MNLMFAINNRENSNKQIGSKIERDRNLQIEFKNFVIRKYLKSRNVSTTIRSDAGWQSRITVCGYPMGGTFTTKLDLKN